MKQATTVLISNFSEKGENKEGIQSLLDQLTGHQVHVISCDFAKDEIALETRNWLTFHQNGVAAVYPVKSKKRRSGRSEVVFETLEAAGICVEAVVDYTEAEEEGCYLEGTRSMVLDKVNEIAYASISMHTDESLFIEFCEDFEYTPIVFSSVDELEEPVSYTSDILFVGDSVAMIASSYIQDKKERKLVLNQLKNSGKKIIYLNKNQVNKGVTATLQVNNTSGEQLFFMAESAYESLHPEQITTLMEYGRIVALEKLPAACTKFRNFAMGIEL
jgi:hypothetical protein